ncbi:hypothetical protein ID866_7121 [Astraeus odoratus]|nr:hypothetical protein ID866_7121 [Astraeus odoratus]
MESNATHRPTVFILPDLLGGFCVDALSRLNPNVDEISSATDRWLLDNAGISEVRAAELKGIKVPVLAALWYPDADAMHLRVCADFLGWLFNMDDWPVDYNERDAKALGECCMAALRDPNFHAEKRGGLLAKSLSVRLRETASANCISRILRGMDLYFKASEKELEYRATGHIPDIESYVSFRRDLSACFPCFAMLEYAYNIDLPSEVVSHPVIIALEDAVNDLISWSNDIYSYNIEQARGETSNLVSIIMHGQGLDLQGAMDQAGAYFEAALQRFQENRIQLPTWGGEIDKNVELYVQGLQNMIVSGLHWSFISERYFGKEGMQVKKERVVTLLPKKTTAVAGQS